ncbi:hypothetical protein D3C84_1252460 [compost metagenome]
MSGRQRAQHLGLQDRFHLDAGDGGEGEAERDVHFQVLQPYQYLGIADRVDVDRHVRLHLEKLF